MAASDEELLPKAAQGDLAALQTMLHRHSGAVRSRIVDKIGDKWRPEIDSDDIMAVTYEDAFFHIRQMRARTTPSFLAWLNKIAENNLLEVIDFLDASKRPPVEKRVYPISEEESCRAFLDLLGLHSTTPSRVVSAAEVCETVRAAVAKLPEDQRRAVQMCDLDGASVGEVAAAMGRSKAAVILLRARARKWLRELLGGSSKFFHGGK